MKSTQKTEILQALYDAEINFTISCFWDAGFEWKPGDITNGFTAEGGADNLGHAITELEKAAIEQYPEYEFRQKII